MFRQDYILRTIRVFIDALILLIRSRHDQDYHRARTIITQTREEIFGLSTAAVMALSERTLLSMLMKRDAGRIDTALMAARLFHEDGLLAMAEERVEEGRELLIKSLKLYLEVALEPSVSPHEFHWMSQDIKASNLMTDPHDAIADLINVLEDVALSQSSMMLLFGYHEKYDAFDRAEDMLYSLAEDYGDDPEVKTLGFRFYERLNAMNDDRLACGGLPRLEVHEGLDQWKHSMG